MNIVSLVRFLLMTLSVFPNYLFGEILARAHGYIMRSLEIIGIMKSGAFELLILRSKHC